MAINEAYFRFYPEIYQLKGQGKHLLFTVKLDAPTVTSEGEESEAEDDERARLPNARLNIINLDTKEEHYLADIVVDDDTLEDIDVNAANIETFSLNSLECCFTSGGEAHHLRFTPSRVIHASATVQPMIME